MTHTADHITSFHRALHRLCGFPELAATVNDQRAWHDFLLEMKPLEDTEGGPFILSDLTAVVSEMARQKRKGIANWSLRPSAILRDPEKFRDMLLQARTDLRVANRAIARPIPRPAIQSLPTGTNRITDDPTPQPEGIPAGEVAAATFADLRKKAGL